MSPLGDVAADVVRRRPECEPWLALLDCAFAPATERVFESMVASAPAAADGEPLLTGLALPIDAEAGRRYVERLLHTASRARDASRPRLSGADALVVLEAAIVYDGAAIDEVAVNADVDPPLLAAVAPVAAIPLLQAHRRAWASRVPPRWAQPFCPICGAWPGLVEVRGLDRTRRFRCLRCAADWPAEWLACPYCGNRDHATLGALVCAEAAETRRAETCVRCHSYVKSVTTLSASEPAALGVLDVETIELDVAALAHGYRRPDRPGHPLGVKIEPRPARGVLGWRW